MSLATVKSWARSVKRDVHALWIAARDPRTPWHAKALAAVVAAYALSPVDLVPDFIPVLGYLDDLVLVPLGIALAVRLIPPALLREFRDVATRAEGQPTSRIAAVFVIALWIAAALAAFFWWTGRT